MSTKGKAGDEGKGNVPTRVADKGRVTIEGVCVDRERLLRMCERRRPKTSGTSRARFRLIVVGRKLSNFDTVQIQSSKFLKSMPLSQLAWIETCVMRVITRTSETNLFM